MTEDPHDPIIAKHPPSKGLLGPLLRVIPILLLVILLVMTLRVKVEIRDDRGAVPQTFEALLWRGQQSRKITVSDGEVSVLRFRWDRLEVTDIAYVRADIPIRGRNLRASIERNTALKLKDAAHGLPSVPQHGDPPPQPGH
jgi:hypothetical protein